MTDKAPNAQRDAVTKNKAPHGNVFLIGMPATGKSTVGRLLGKLLGCPFYDSDEVIETRSGAAVSWIFDVEGEAGFREREYQALKDLTGMQGVVVATGGGAVLRPENRQLLSRRGTVVWLDSSDKRIHARTAKDTKRPLLSGAKGAEAIARLRAERLPLYQSTADFTVITDRQPARSVAKQIIRELAALAKRPAEFSEALEVDTPEGGCP